MALRTVTILTYLFIFIFMSLRSARKKARGEEQSWTSLSGPLAKKKLPNFFKMIFRFVSLILLFLEAETDNFLAKRIRTASASIEPARTASPTEPRGFK